MLKTMLQTVIIQVLELESTRPESIQSAAKKWTPKVFFHFIGNRLGF